MSDYTPDTPMSVMTLFDADKRALEHFVDAIVNQVSEGNENPLKVLALARKMEFALKRINEAIKDNIEREAMKYPKGKFEMLGTEMEYTPTWTEYDYSVCGYPDWEEADAAERSGKNNKKIAETFLRAIKVPFTMIDSRTGEVITINPPLKKQTMGVKTSIK